MMKIHFLHFSEECPFIITNPSHSVLVFPKLLKYIVDNGKNGKKMASIMYGELNICSFCIKYYHKGSTFTWGGGPKKEKWFSCEPEELL